MKNIQLVSELRFAIEPQHTCSLAGAYIGIVGLKNAALVAHASPGCGFAMRYGLAQHWKSFLPCPVTNICETEIINGSQDLLFEALKKAAKVHSPDVLYLLTGCSAALIGEDYTAVAKTASCELGIPIVTIPTGGIQGDFLYGYNAFLTETLRASMAFHQHTQIGLEEKLYMTGIIPRYDMHWRGDCTEINKLVADLFSKNVEWLATDSIDLNRLGNLSANDTLVSINPRIMNRQAQKLCGKSGCNVSIMGYAPIGIEYTKRFLLELGQHLGDDVDYLQKRIELKVDKLRRDMLRGFDFAKVMYSSARLAVIGEPSQTIPLLNLLVNEMGMKPVMAAFTESATDDELSELDAIMDIRGHTISLLNKQDNSLIKEYLVREGVNIVFGRSLDRVPGSNIVHITWQFPSSDHFVVFARPIMGFGGVLSVVDYVINGFSKTWY